MSFQFKQFKITHHPNVFKFGTDAALLSTWVDIESNQNILEIGTGSGVITLMMAQRNQTANYTGIDISDDAISLANMNLDSYPIPSQIKFEHSSIQNFSTNTLFDHIVSNPPFFESSTKSPFELKNTTRHTDELSLKDLLSYSLNLLTPNGKISIIYPVRYLDDIKTVSDKLQLSIEKLTYTRSKPEKDIKRVLVTLSHEPQLCVENELIIEGDQKGYSSEVFEMFAPFYLYL